MATQLFGPEMWDTLKASPETAAMLEDPSFKAVLSEIKTDPSTLAKHTADPRVMKVFATLAASSQMPAAPAAPGGGGGDGSGRGAAVAEAGSGEEEDLTQLPEEERRAKQALRAKGQGNAAYKKRDFPAAIALYSDAIALHPDNVALLTNRGAARFESGDFDGCIADCAEAVQRNTERSLRTDFKVIARAWARIGNAHMRVAPPRLVEAIEAYGKSLVESHDEKVYRAHKEALRAKEKADAAAYVDPEVSAKERAEGNVFFKAGDFPASIKKYTEAIKRNPEDATPYSNRAASYMKLGEFPMALKDCDRCLELDPSFVKAYVRKGNIHFFMKEYHKCIEVYEKGLKVEPNSKELRQGLMKTKYQIGQQQGSGEVDEEQVRHAMADPEIQNILNDPEVQSMLKQMEQDPSIANKVMQSDPVFAAKVEKLIAAGVLRVQ